MIETGMQQIIIGVVLGAIPVLLSQWLSGWWGVKHRKAEVYLSNKSDSYAALFVAVHELLNSPRNELKYAAYRSAFERAKMFASDDVRKLLEGDKRPGPDTLSHSIELLRQSEDATNELRVRVRNLYSDMSKLSDACRHDMESLGLGL